MEEATVHSGIFTITDHPVTSAHVQREGTRPRCGCHRADSGTCSCRALSSAPSQFLLFPVSIFLSSYKNALLSPCPLPSFASQKNSFDMSIFALTNLLFSLETYCKSNVYLMHAIQSLCINVKISKDRHVAKSHGKSLVLILRDQLAVSHAVDSCLFLKTLLPGFQGPTLSWLASTSLAAPF